jgi:MOSC N-terminal beta barrel domain
LIVEGGTIWAYTAPQCPYDMTSTTPLQANFEFQASIAALWVYPIKSCAGVQMSQALLTDTGLEFDRA